MDFPLYIDLTTSRVVYQDNVLVGVRSVTLDKGASYNCPITFTSGLATGLNPPVSGFIYSLSQLGMAAGPIITSTAYNSGAFTLNLSSPVLDFILSTTSTGTFQSNISFSGGGNTYVVTALETVVNNTPFIAPSQEYYPLDQNPSGYVGSAALASYYPLSNPSGFITAAQTGNFLSNSSGVLLQGEIAVLQSETGSFYSRTNPSGYLTAATTPVTSVAGRTGTVTLTKSDVGLSGVQNVDTTNAANISAGTLPAARLPSPTATTLGGIESIAAQTSKYITSISTAGVPTLAQPAFTDIAGVGSPSQVGLGNVTNDAQLKASQLDTDPTLAADSDSNVASQKAVKAYVDANAGGGGGGVANPMTSTLDAGENEIINVDGISVNSIAGSDFQFSNGGGCYFDGGGVSTDGDGNLTCFSLHATANASSLDNGAIFTDGGGNLWAASLNNNSSAGFSITNDVVSFCIGGGADFTIGNGGGGYCWYSSNTVQMDNGAIFTDGAGTFTAFTLQIGSDNLDGSHNPNPKPVIDSGGIFYVGNSSSAPPTTFVATAGAIYYDVYYNKLKVYNGTTWETITSA